jgi:hypothetical protein
MRMLAMRDAYDSATDGGEDDKRLDWMLENWAHWMRQRVTPRGFPTKSVGLRSVGGADFESMVDAVDVRLARAIDAIIDSLPLNERTAVHHVWLASVWRLRVDIYETHTRARVAIRDLMRKRRIE